jgi:hypothetical protein
MGRPHTDVQAHLANSRSRRIQRVRWRSMLVCRREVGSIVMRRWHTRSKWQVSRTPSCIGRIARTEHLSSSVRAEFGACATPPCLAISAPSSRDVGQGPGRKSFRRLTAPGPLSDFDNPLSRLPLVAGPADELRGTERVALPLARSHARRGSPKAGSERLMHSTQKSGER